MKKHEATSNAKPAVPAKEAPKVEANAGTDKAPEAKAAKAPRIVRNRYLLIDSAGREIKFTHYPLPTKRTVTGTIKFDGVEANAGVIVTKSTSRDKSEQRAYSYLTLPNGSTGYVSEELKLSDAVYKVKELPPAEPFGGKKHTPEGQTAAAA